MKKLMFIFSVFIIFSSCDLNSFEEEFYYKKTAALDNVQVEVEGKGYGKYGQLLEKKSNEVEGIFTEDGFSVGTTSADINNGVSSNEIFITFIFPEPRTSFSAKFALSEPYGLDSFKITCKESEEKEFTAVSSFSEDVSYNSSTPFTKMVVYVKLFKFFPDNYSSFRYRTDVTEAVFKSDYKGKLTNNTFTMSCFK